MIHPSVLLASCLLAANVSAATPLAGWRHEGTVWLLTTPEGADLPAPARVENFPVLLRLDKSFFNFAEARADGADLRVASSDGTTLPHQIEQWDAVNGAPARSAGR